MERILAAAAISLMMLPPVGRVEAATLFDAILVGFAKMPHLTMARLPEDTPLWG